MAKKTGPNSSALIGEIADDVGHALTQASSGSASLGETPIGDSDRLYDLALQIVQGSIALDEVTNLSAQDRARVAELVAQIIALRSDPATKRQQRANPYYNPSGSRIIKDGK